MSAYFIFVVCITLNPETEIHLQLAQHSQIRTDIVYVGVKIISSGGVIMNKGLTDPCNTIVSTLDKLYENVTRIHFSILVIKFTLSSFKSKGIHSILKDEASGNAVGRTWGQQLLLAVRKCRWFVILLTRKALEDNLLTFNTLSAFVFHLSLYCFFLG
jgi:hypothetical protein